MLSFLQQLSRLVLLGLLLVRPVKAQVGPLISDVAPRGIQIGGMTLLDIRGAGLNATAQVVLPFPAFTQRVVAVSDDGGHLQVEVVLPEKITPGIYQLLVATSQGISSPVAFGVDTLPQRRFEKTIQSLPVACSGQISGRQVLRTKFFAKAGQTIVIDVEAQRLGSALHPVVRLLDERHAQIAWSGGLHSIAGDARCSTVIPSDAEYTIELHDALYAELKANWFRLKVGKLWFADHVMPLGVRLGTATTFRPFSTNLPDTARLVLRTDARGRNQVDWNEGSAALTGALPRYFVSQHLEITEAPTRPQVIATIPVGISGLLDEQEEEDAYWLSVDTGTVLEIQIYANRIGSPLDGVIIVRNHLGHELAVVDDQAHTRDPGLTFNVPENTDRLEIAIRDMKGRVQKPAPYRLVVKNASAPRVQLSVETDRIQVPAGGSQIVPVHGYRVGNVKPVRLTVDGLPAGVHVENHFLGTARNTTLVRFTAEESGLCHSLIRMTGDWQTDDGQATTLVLSPETQVGRYQPQLRSELGFAVTVPAGFQLGWKSSQDDPVVAGSTWVTSLAVSRWDELPGRIRLTVLTDQQLSTELEEKQRNLRAIRLLSPVEISHDERETQLKIMVPPDLPPGPWQIACRGELLAEDGKTVLATNVSTVRRIEVVMPCALQLTSARHVEVKSGLGETGRFQGRIERLEGFNQDLELTLSGLPSGYAAPRLRLSADDDRFNFPIRFPYGVGTGEFKNLKLVAILAAGSDFAARTTRSRPISVSLRVVPGEKPEADQPLKVFEDEGEFVAQLTQGEGTAKLAIDRVYSGQASIKIIANEKSNANLDGFAYEICEKPRPGQYRFLRFAWRKLAGQTICLSLAKNGKFGSDKTNALGYHAGTEQPCSPHFLKIGEFAPRDEFVVVTRDLYADFGEFILTGFGFAAADRSDAWFDHVYLGRTIVDFELVAPGEIQE